MNIIFIGKPGSGKGTLSSRLAKELDYKLIVAGDLLRKAKEEKGPLAKQIANLIDGGNLVPHKVIDNLMFEEIRKPIKIKKYHIIDGYPRTQKSAEYLETLLKVSRVFYLDVSDDEVISRLTKRSREDDGLESIKNRLEHFNSRIDEILIFYGKRIIKIDASKPEQEVYDELIENLEFEERVFILEREFEDEENSGETIL